MLAFVVPHYLTQLHGECMSYCTWRVIWLFIDNSVRSEAPSGSRGKVKPHSCRWSVFHKTFALLAQFQLFHDFLLVSQMFVQFTESVFGKQLYEIIHTVAVTVWVCERSGPEHQKEMKQNWSDFSGE